MVGVLIQASRPSLRFSCRRIPFREFWDTSRLIQAHQMLSANRAGWQAGDPVYADFVDLGLSERAPSRYDALAPDTIQDKVRYHLTFILDPVS